MNPRFSPKTKISSIFERNSVYIDDVLSGQPAIHRGWPPNTGSTVKKIQPGKLAQ